MTTCLSASLGIGSSALAATTANYRGGNTPVLSRVSYDYAPSVMKDGVYRMWWCGGVAGDYILYAEADSPQGPWHARGSTTPNSYDYALTPTGDPADHDGIHTCDPSVVWANGKYYMYYGGLDTATNSTTIGVAASDDGITWARLNGGQPIIRPHRPTSQVANKYGAGQPSVIWLNGKFYLIYTDTTGIDVDSNGAGQFVLRSADPTFQAGVEELTSCGFLPMNASTHTHHALLHAFSVDWQYVDTNDTFAVAVDGETAGATRIHLFNSALNQQVDQFDIPGTWREGPALISRPDKHAVPSSTCGVVPFDVLRSVGAPAPQFGTWDLAHSGVNLLTGVSCDEVPVSRVYEGYAIVVPGLPLTLVKGGLRLQFALAAPASHLSRNGITVSSDIFHRVPFGASMFSGSQVLQAPGRPGAFLLNGRLWPVSCSQIVSANNSSITMVSTSVYDSYPLAPELYCLQ